MSCSSLWRLSIKDSETRGRKSIQISQMGTTSYWIKCSRRFMACNGINRFVFIASMKGEVQIGLELFSGLWAAVPGYPPMKNTE